MANWAEAQYVIDSITGFIEGGGASSLTDNGIYVVSASGTSTAGGEPAGSVTVSATINVATYVKPEFLSRITTNNFIVGLTSSHHWNGGGTSQSSSINYNNATHVATGQGISAYIKGGSVKDTLTLWMIIPLSWKK